MVEKELSFPARVTGNALPRPGNFLLVTVRRANASTQTRYLGVAFASLPPVLHPLRSAKGQSRHSEEPVECQSVARLRTLDF
jgi:hypothetical protein